MDVSKIQIGNQICTFNDSDLQTKVQNHIQQSNTIQAGLVQSNNRLEQDMKQLIGDYTWQKSGSSLQTYISSNQSPWAISSTCLWLPSKTTSVRKHIAVQCQGGYKYELTGGVGVAYYTFAKTYTTPTRENEPINVATGCSRFSLNAGQTKSGTVPSDATYLIIETVRAGSNVAPSKISISSGGGSIDELSQRVTAVQNYPHQSVNWVAMGDSITAGTYSFYSANPSTLGEITTNTDETKGWAYKSAQILKWNIQNEAFGGTGWNKSYNGDSTGSKTAFAIANEIAQRTDTSGNVVGFKKYELVTLAYGINDWKNNRAIGDLSDDFNFDSTPSTAIAGMRKTIQTIYRSNPKIKIIVITPLNCAGKFSNNKYEYEDADNFALGYRYSNSGTLEQFFQKMIAVCDYYGIQYIDQTHYSVFNRLNIIDKTIGSAKITGLSCDGIHPTVEGHTAIALQMSRKLISCSNGCYNKTSNAQNTKTEVVQEVTSKSNVYCWGDSLTQGEGSNITLNDGVFTQFNLHPYTNEIRSRNVVNLGCQGESMVTIMARQGADPMVVSNITIPADTSDVIVGSVTNGISTRSGAKVYPLNPNEAGINPCVINGIQGVLHRGFTQNDSDKNIYFRRLKSGQSVSVTSAVINTYAMRKYRNGFAVIWAGANGGHSGVIDFCTKIKSMVKYGAYDNYIVVISRQFSASDVQAIRQNLGTDGVDHVVYVYDELQTRGLSLANMAHYYFDTSSYANGDKLLLNVPILCECNINNDGQPIFGNLHFSAYGYKAIGKIVEQRINMIEKQKNSNIFLRDVDDEHGHMTVKLANEYTNNVQVLDTKFKAYDGNKDWTIVMKFSDAVANLDGTYGSVMQLRDDSVGITLHLRYVASQNKFNLAISSGYGFNLDDDAFFSWTSGHISTDGSHYIGISKSSNSYVIFCDGYAMSNYGAPLSGGFSSNSIRLFGRLMPNSSISQKVQTTINDFRVYDFAMTSDQITSIYNELKGD